MVGTVGWSMGQALTAPGTDTVQVRLAEWGRDHGLGGVVTTLERWQYELNPPPVGGTPDASQLNGLGPTAGARTGPGQGQGRRAVPGARGHPDAPGDRPAGLPGTEQRRGCLPRRGGDPGRPAGDPVGQGPPGQHLHLGAQDVLWIDQKDTSYVLHPGTEGGTNSEVPVSDQINASQRPNLIALFNGGFKIEESQGGYFDQGITVAPLKNGAASEVITKDGHLSMASGAATSR